uniref:FMRFamide-like neuropeptide PF5 n=1 Tax=Panagrellus redivivus TaxID=6233 RepID=FAR5_PANRE|nr:RecName: Full=FMRFamide-like neuropeptide PF5; AltName: Full=AMRNALVRF-amide [Panagrellus redivivus]
AMRNALVRF